MISASRPRRRSLKLIFGLGLGALLLRDACSEPAAQERLDGLNVIAAPGHPFGSASAKASLTKARELGGRAIAVVPFLWQPTPASADLERGSDMTDAELRAGIRDAHALGLAVLVKPHVWVPNSWAGAVTMKSETDWQKWFANYRREVQRIAQIAGEQQAEAFAIGTELELTTQRPEWNELIDAVRGVYHRRLFYVAHNVEEAETAAFWDRLDAVGVTLYPPLGADNDLRGRRAAMRTTADRLDMLAALTAKPIVVGEIGLRSAAGAAARPWESVQERAAAPDPALQAEVIADWLDVLDRPAIGGVMIWEWLTDPDAGGPSDTDFTVQGKPAELVLTCAWTRQCKEELAAP